MSAAIAALLGALIGAAASIVTNVIQQRYLMRTPSPKSRYCFRVALVLGMATYSELAILDKPFTALVSEE